MARIESRRPAAPAAPSGPSVAWRGARAAGSFALAPLARLLRRLLVLALVLFLVSLGYRSIATKVRTPAQPTRIVSPSDGRRLALLRKAGQRDVTLQEGDLTAALRQAAALPTFPLRDGQVVLRPGIIEVFGRLKGPSVTALIDVRPTVSDGRVSFTLERVRIGQQSIPRLLFPLVKVPTIDQAALFTQAIVEDVARVQVSDGALIVSFP